jgi:DNA-binding transcriptional MerR regulator
MRLPDLFDPADTSAAARGASAPTQRRTSKSAEAFRTISEVADDLDVPQHVLRFWESRFPQIKPLKRAGGRRYYRPEDVILLRRIRQCLYEQGYTIKGVQKLLREGALKSDGRTAVARTARAELRHAKPSPDGLRELLIDVRKELVALRETLAKAPR